jgi:hypothetical protein
VRARPQLACTRDRQPGAGPRGAEEDAELLERERSHYLSLLREIPADRARLDERERDLVRYLRTIGIGWDEIAKTVGGFSAGWQAAEKYGEPEPGEAPF